MDNPDSQGGSRPPRKELQGPRPTPLKVRKESHKIKKPPVAPPANPPHQHQQVPSQPPPPPRQPVIIYTVSPKVIHTHPSEFMTLVQRLTGPDATSSSSSSTQYPSSNFTTTTSSSSSNIVTGFSSTTTSHHHVITGGVSPAARFASIERTKMHPEAKRMHYIILIDSIFVIHVVIINIQEDACEDS
uniref:VQ domain-containing protein n=1 Tax=Chenopodium quinoa TaxID=63459 RepID=A0A803LHR5_CHEQI